MKRMLIKSLALALVMVGIVTSLAVPPTVQASTDVIASPKVIATTTQGGTTDTANLQAVKGPVYAYASGASSSLGQTLTYSYRVDTASSTGTWTNGTSVTITADGVYTVYFRVCDQSGQYDLSSSWTHVSFQINNSLPALSASGVSGGISLTWNNPDTSQSYSTMIYRLDQISNYVDGSNLISSADSLFTKGTGDWRSESHTYRSPSLSVANDATNGNYLKVTNTNNEIKADTRTSIPVSGFVPFHTYKVKARIRFPNRDFSTSGLDVSGNPTDQGESNNSLIFVVNGDNTAGLTHTPNNTSDTASNVAVTNFNDGGWHDVYLIFNSQSNAILNIRFDLWTMAEMDICQPQVVPLTLPPLATTAGTSYTDTTVKDSVAPSGGITGKSVTTSSLTKSLQLSSTASDEGTNYKYQIATTGSSDSMTRDSNICTATYTSGLKGFYYRLDTSGSSETLSASNSTFVSYTGGTPASIDVSTFRGGTYYLHTALIDNSGNQAASVVSSTTIPGVVSVTLPAQTSYSIDPNSNTVSVSEFTLVNNSQVDSVQVTLQNLQSQSTGITLFAQVVESTSGSTTWSEIDNGNVQQAGGASTILGVLSPGGTGHIKITAQLNTLKWPTTVFDTGSMIFQFTAVS